MRIWIQGHLQLRVEFKTQEQPGLHEIPVEKERKVD